MRGRHQRRRPVRAAVAALAGTLSIGTVAVMAGVAPAEAVTNAVSTTTNVNYGAPGAGDKAGDGACLNGKTDGGASDVVNCNHYADKRDVWLSGLPSELPNGQYFFAVLAPGGQQDPNDGTAKNLSDDFDSSMDRSFFQEDGEVTSNPSGKHAVANGKIQLWRYADTPNPGGVYILAVCAGDGSGAVNPSDCKYDAYKVDQTEEPPCEGYGCPPSCDNPDYYGNCPPPVTELDPLTVTKDADGTYDRTFTWTVNKTAGTPTWSGETATVPYTVTVTPDSGTKGNYAVTGTITVMNPNAVSVSDVAVTDQLTIHRAAGGTTTVDCTVTSSDASPTVAEAGDSTYPYSCSGFTLADGDTVDNTVTAAWGDNIPGPGFDYFLPAGSSDFTFQDVDFTGADIDECVAVTDVFNGGTPQTLDSSVCVGDPAADFAIPVSKTVVVQSGCKDVTNTGTYTTNDKRLSSSSSVTTKLCRPYANTSGHTMGFWRNTNGQATIGSFECAALSTWLKGYAPFADLSSSTCSGVKSYTTTTINNASAAGATMNRMLKGQMLSTALSVWATSHVNTTVKKYFGATPANLGAVSVDLNPVCANPGSCSSFIDARGAFGGAESKTVSQALAYAASQSTSGGTTWYAQVKATQEKAKDVFDAINNNVIYAP